MCFALEGEGPSVAIASASLFNEAIARGMEVLQESASPHNEYMSLSQPI